MSLDDQDVQRFANATRQFERALEKMAQASPGNQAVITVNAGGIGLWIAVTCCAVMLALGVFGAVTASYVLLDQNKRIEAQDSKLERMQDYINAIYVQAPSLRPKEKSHE